MTDRWAKLREWKDSNQTPYLGIRQELHDLLAERDSLEKDRNQARAVIALHQQNGCGLQLLKESEFQAQLIEAIEALRDTRSAWLAWHEGRDGRAPGHVLLAIGDDVGSFLARHDTREDTVTQPTGREIVNEILREEGLLTEPTRTRDLTPQLETWPACPTCETPWVLRRALQMMSGEYQWLWSRDCKHKAPPVMRGEK